jgi:hypothetical protein
LADVPDPACEHSRRGIKDPVADDCAVRRHEYIREFSNELREFRELAEGDSALDSLEKLQREECILQRNVA